MTGSASITPAATALPVPGRIRVPRVLPAAAPGSIPVARPISDDPTPGRIWAGGGSPVPTPGRIRVERVAGLKDRRGVAVARVRASQPRAGTLTADAQDDRSIGATGLGTIAVADPVIARIAARAVLDVPDAGGVAPTVIGKLAGGRLGVRETSLDSLPKTIASVDGTRAFVTTTVSIRWPAPIAKTAQAVRDNVRQQVEHMVGIEVPEVEVRVEALIERTSNGPRVR